MFAPIWGRFPFYITWFKRVGSTTNFLNDRSRSSFPVYINCQQFYQLHGVIRNRKKAIWSGTVDGRNPAPVEVGSLSHYLQGFIHVRWCRNLNQRNLIFQPLISGDTRVSMEVIVTIVSKLVYNPFRGHIQNWLVVSMTFYFHPYLGKWSNLTSIFFNWVETTK